ncbi:hypothetical protein [Halocatena pleomorpha]|uniref:Uncharacterized protein n=1 Tax=Halocatena pleomorpha TaxID=1785090 RepID=A0A3P3RH02_9EURY|nr:hypothetical protein [Halocatena pleomorpha]RRJ32665.1 hypothetical protein EIK79_04195 [Halocatena pleomorpha]
MDIEDDKISERGELNKGFIRRQKERIATIEDRDDHIIYDRPAKIRIQAVKGRNISDWDVDFETTVEGGGWTTFEVTGHEYRIKLYGIEKRETHIHQLQSGLHVCVSVDRFENDRWVEYIDKGGSHHHDLRWDVSYDIEFLKFME